MFFYQLSLRFKLIIIILLTLCLPFIIFGIIWYHKSTKTIENNAIIYSEQIVQQLNNNLDSYFMDLERIILPILPHPLIQDLMELDPENEYEHFYLRKKIKNELFPNIFFGRPDILGISILTNNGLTLTNYGTTMSTRINSYKNLNSLEMETFKNITVSTVDNVPVITISKPLFNTATYKKSGFLIIDLKLREFSKMSNRIELGETGFVSILDSNDKVIYHPTLKAGEAFDLVSTNKFTDPEGSFTVETPDGEKLVTYHRSSLTNTLIISEVPINELLTGLFDLRNVTIIIVITLILFALLMVGGYAFYFTNSLSLLQKKMKEAERGNLNVRAPEGHHDEIGKLNQSFNKMVSKMNMLIDVVHKSQLREKELIIKQRDAKVQSMQTQINPHFLYNTLEIINSYAIVKGVFPISHMTTSLADMFRYSIQDINEKVTLKDEMMHIEAFLTIQKERYNSLNVKVEFDHTPLSEIRAIRLILQPIIENAFKYGYDDAKLKPEFLKICGEMKNNYYSIRIIDKGLGMNPNVREKYNTLFEITDIQEIQDGETSESIGLWNVHSRIRLAFGEPYGLFIEKSDHTGTTMELRLPLPTPIK